MTTKLSGATGYGLMGLTSDPENKLDHEKCLTAMKAAADNGATVWNSADFYGKPDRLENIELIAKYFERYPEDVDKITVTVKGCTKVGQWLPDGSDAATRRSMDDCLRVLGKYNKPDVFVVARQDPSVSYTETAAAIKEYLDSGKLKAYGISECGSETIKKWNAIAPVGLVEIEYSVWSQEAKHNGVFDTCKELGIPVLAYSPLGRGYLTGTIKSSQDFSSSDVKGHMPRFTDENLQKNYGLVEKLKSIGQKHNVQPSQVALEFIRARSGTEGYPTIIPIPGSSNPERIRTNCQRFGLSRADIDGIDEFLKSFQVTGLRYPEFHEKQLSYA